MQLFPLIEQAGRSPVNFLATLKSVSQVKHACDGYTACPLLQAVSSLEYTLEAEMKRLPGLDLRHFKTTH